MIPSRSVRVQNPDKMSQGLLPRKELVERKEVSKESLLEMEYQVEPVIMLI